MELTGFWLLLIPASAVLLAVVTLPRFSTLRADSQLSFIALLIFFGLQLLSIGFTSAPYVFAPSGSEVVRLIPILQFDPHLLQTRWLVDQTSLGLFDFLVAALAFPGRIRAPLVATILLVGVGMELNQAAVNARGIVPAYRIDIHDVLVRSLGALIGAVALLRLRRWARAREAASQQRNFVTTHAATQAPSTVLMIRPLGFNPNVETAIDNAFQGAPVVDPLERQRVAAAAQIEASVVATALRGAGVEVLMLDDRPGIDTPDSVFPNNWISTHEDGRVVLYPMATPSRRRERRGDVVDALRARFVVGQVLDLSPLETEGRYLEGTGALVLDHVNRIAYMARSGRADEAALDQWCDAMGYSAEVFDTIDAAGKPIYHTNVVLSIATEFVVVGLDSIPDSDERARVAARLAESGREIIAIDPVQVAEFAANGLELNGRLGRIFAVSTRAAAALHPEQVAAIEASARLLPISIPTIERSGGSVRCMLAGIHLRPLLTPAATGAASAASTLPNPSPAP